MRVAICARYSTDLQSAASVADQMRLCYIAGYNAVKAASSRNATQERAEAVRRLGEAERKLGSLLDALAEGIRAPGLQKKLDALETSGRV